MKQKKNNSMHNGLPVILETSTELAEYLNVEEVVLVRDDKLPNGGGKKRRSLIDYTGSIKTDQVIHVLSYAGSHTAYTLAKTLKNNKVILYGVTYPGGRYGKIMQEKLAAMPNVKQTVGSKFEQTLKFYTNNLFNELLYLKSLVNSKQKTDIQNNSKNTNVFMKPGGSLGRDLQYEHAASYVEQKIGNLHTHYAAVASGDMLTALQKKFPNAFGVLTQPLLIRLVKFFKLKNAKSLLAEPIEKRETIMHEVAKKTGNLWDPVFMGSVFSYLKKQKKLPKKICIWISCPAGITW